MLHRLRVAEDRGETLLELMISLAILGVAVVTIAAGIALSIKTSDVHRKEVTASAYARDFAEALQNSVAGSGYSACATTATYASVYSVPAADSSFYSSSVSTVEYWNG